GDARWPAPRDALGRSGLRSRHAELGAEHRPRAARRLAPWRRVSIPRQETALVPRRGDSASAGRPITPARACLDYAGFAPVAPRVMAVMRPCFEGGVGNPSAPHSLGAEARAALEAARVKVARLCGGAPSGVIFTSGATEANNLAVRGLAAAAREPA